jgi:hypothetical protein
MQDIVQLLQWNFDPLPPTARPSSTSTQQQEQQELPAGTTDTDLGPDPAPLSMRSDGYELNLVGHSMGAAISVLYASAFPEVVTGKVVLIENFGMAITNHCCFCYCVCDLFMLRTTALLCRCRPVDETRVKDCHHPATGN